MPFIKGYNVAVLGATGLVGRTVLKVKPIELNK